jgi:hypothetical protein
MAARIASLAALPLGILLCAASWAQSNTPGDISPRSSAPGSSSPQNPPHRGTRRPRNGSTTPGTPGNPGTGGGDTGGGSGGGR